jgi:signal transduction histidine kinase
MHRTLIVDNEVELRDTRKDLEKQITARTAELREVNKKLEQEIVNRRQTEAKLKTSLKELQKEQEKRASLSKHLIDLSERERKQLSMDLHDNIGQVLTGLKMSAEIIFEKMKKRDDALTGEMALLEERATESIRKLKDFSHLLRPDILERFGLLPSLIQLFDEIEEASGLQIRFFSKGVKERFDNEKELTCFRIVQGALNNIINHAGAKEVFVNLIRNYKTLSLSVEDVGVGFDLNKIHDSSDEESPLGVLIMEERAKSVGGTFSIDSRVGQGTRVMAEIPV